QVGGGVRDRHAVDADIARVDRLQPIERAQQGALARARRPDHHQHFAALDAAVDVGERRMRRLPFAMKGLVYCFDHDQWIRHGLPSQKKVSHSTSEFRIVNFSAAIPLRHFPNAAAPRRPPMTTPQEILRALGLNDTVLQGGTLAAHSPIDGARLAQVHEHTVAQAHAAITRARQASQAWRLVPAPRRGELVRLFGEVLRRHKRDLGRLVSLEAGKILAEGEGEVQEMIDICDFALGLSRQLYGLTIASERPGHRMMETWHPLGVVGVISACNFPVAVWSLNTALALVCGNAVVWKPSEKTPLTALACQALFAQALQQFGDAPAGLLEVLIGGRQVGETLVDSHDVALVSATGSTRMGRQVAPRVAQRFGRVLLELGGNNAIIVAPSADLDMAARGIVFGAIGTAGQRCTTTRRLIVHESIADDLLARLRAAYASAPIGNPLDAGTLVGPLIDRAAFDAMQQA